MINIRFDDSENTANQEHWYQMDHYRPVVESGAVEVVDSFKELDTALASYLANPSHRAPGRQWLRENLMDPLDGKSGERLAEVILA